MLFWFLPYDFYFSPINEPHLFVLKLHQEVAAGTIKIPAYYVDNSVGLDLLEKLRTYDLDINASVRIMVRVTMYPPQNSVPGAWEFTLIVVVVLLAISFLTSGELGKRDREGEGNGKGGREGCGLLLENEELVI